MDQGAGQSSEGRGGRDKTSSFGSSSSLGTVGHGYMSQQNIAATRAIENARKALGTTTPATMWSSTSALPTAPTLEEATTPQTVSYQGVVNPSFQDPTLESIGAISPLASKLSTLGDTLYSSVLSAAAPQVNLGVNAVGTLGQWGDVFGAYGFGDILKDLANTVKNPVRTLVEAFSGSPHVAGVDEEGNVSAETNPLSRLGAQVFGIGQGTSSATDDLSTNLSKALKSSLGLAAGAGALSPIYNALAGAQPALNMIGLGAKAGGLLGSLTDSETLSNLSGLVGSLTNPVGIGNIAIDALTSGIKGTPTGLLAGLTGLGGDNTTDTTNTTNTAGGGTTNVSNGGNEMGTVTSTGTYNSNNSVVGSGSGTTNELLTALSGLLGGSGGNLSSLLGGTSGATGGNVDLSSLLQNYQNYASGALDKGNVNYDDLQQQMINSSLSPINIQQDKDVQLLEENLAKRGIGLTSGPWNTSVADLLGDYGAQKEKAISEAMATRYGLENSAKTASEGYGVQANNSILNYLTNLASIEAQKYGIDTTASTAAKAANAASDAALGSGIGSIIGTVAPSVIDLIGNLFKPSEETSTGGATQISSLGGGGGSSTYQSAGYF